MIEDESIERHLLMLEQRLLEPHIRRSPAEAGALLADDFAEFSSTGRAYDKAQILEALRTSSPARFALADFKVVRLSANVALATFRVIRDSTPERPAAESLRSSVWKKIGGRWRMVFHQGTLCEEK
jgi:glyoxylase I family protein